MDDFNVTVSLFKVLVFRLRLKFSNPLFNFIRMTTKSNQHWTYPRTYWSSWTKTWWENFVHFNIFFFRVRVPQIHRQYLLQIKIAVNFSRDWLWKKPTAQHATQSKQSELSRNVELKFIIDWLGQRGGHWFLISKFCRCCLGRLLLRSRKTLRKWLISLFRLVCRLIACSFHDRRSWADCIYLRRHLPLM